MIEQLKNYAKQKKSIRVSLDIDYVRMTKIEFLKKVTGIGATADIFRALIDNAYNEVVKEENIN